MTLVTLTMNPAIDLSAEVDRVVHTHKLRAGSVRRDPGGGGINVARVIQRLGGKARAIYPIGGGIGDVLRRLVDEEGIESQTVPVADDTRESFTVDETRTGHQYRFVLPGPALSAEEWQACLAAVAELQADLLVMSGSLPQGVPDDFFAHAAASAKAAGARVVLDTSGAPLAAALEEGVFLIKPNLREMQELTGAKLEGKRAWAVAARRLVEDGRAEAVALTLGHRGGLLASREGTLFAPPLDVTPVSAVGAGDSFLAAMVWGLASGRDMADAFRAGMAAGSAALLTPGTGLCDPADVARLYDRVLLEAMM